MEEVSTWWIFFFFFFFLVVVLFREMFSAKQLSAFRRRGINAYGDYVDDYLINIYN